EVFTQGLRVVDEGVGDDVGVLVPLLVGVFSSGRPHRGVPPRDGELRVTEGLGAEQRRGRTRGDADDACGLRGAGGGATEVEVGGGDDRVGAHVHELFAVVADGDRVALAIEVDELDLLTEHPAVVIEVVDREFDSAHDGFIQWRLDAGEAQASPDNDFRAITLDLWRLFALRLGRGFGLSGSGISPARTQAKRESSKSRYSPN